jgi:hypothetical protein
MEICSAMQVHGAHWQHTLYINNPAARNTLAQATSQHSTDVHFFAFRIDPSAAMRPGGQSSHGPKGNATKAFTIYSVWRFTIKEIRVNDKFDVWLRNIYFYP